MTRRFGRGDALLIGVGQLFVSSGVLQHVLWHTEHHVSVRRFKKTGRVCWQAAASGISGAQYSISSR